MNSHEIQNPPPGNDAPGKMTAQKQYGRSGHIRHYSSLCDSASGQLCYELTNTPSFSSSYNTAPLPVLLHYGARPLHRLKIRSLKWDIERLREELRSALIRGDTSHDSGKMYRRDLLFGTRQGTFLHLDCDDSSTTLNVYAPSPRRTVLVAGRLRRYLIAASKPLPTFHILRKGEEGLTTHEVAIKDFHPMDAEGLNLNYGEGFADWSEHLLDKLRSKDSGLVILDGAPGTGKSTFLKNLIYRLAESHRFLFIQPHYAGVISEPNFVDFWIDQARQHPDKKFCLIMEDGEKVLMRREDDNRSEVSSLLQITDGLMGSFLSLTALFSINCQATQLDPALLRPGRLICRKSFSALKREEARKIAAKLGKPLPPGESITLAQIYNDAVEEPEVEAGKILGFAAA